MYLLRNSNPVESDVMLNLVIISLYSKTFYLRGSYDWKNQIPLQNPRENGEGGMEWLIELSRVKNNVRLNKSAYLEEVLTHDPQSI